MSKSVLTGKNRNKLGRFVKGNKANPTGKNGYMTIWPLIAALKKRGLRKKQDFWDYVAERVNTNDQVLIAVLKKLLPDKLAGEGFDKGTQIIIVRPNGAVKDKTERIPR